MRTVIFVPEPSVWRRAGAPGGLSLLERQLKQLRALACAPPLLLVPDGDPTPDLPPECATAGLERVPADGAGAVAALAAAAYALPPDFLFLSADRLVDLRILRALLAAPAPILASDDAGTAEPIGRVRAEHVRRHGVALAERAAHLPLASLDPYHFELRGVVPPYLLAVRSPADRRAAWGVLLDHVQKRALDLPGQYFDTPFENFLVRRLAPTWITPNQITLITLVLAVVVGTLFLQGWLRSAVALALVVGVLDGVDGKLARLKLATSKIGELEHVGDFFYENFWYVALALHFRAATGMMGFARAGAVLVACDLADNLLYATVRARTGKMLDEMAPFDRRFRRVAGRRNVYVMTMAAGVLFGHAAAAFLATAAWAAVTVAVHAGRTAAALLGDRAARAEPAQSSEIEPATGALVSEK